jgi:hypothetical protein
MTGWLECFMIVIQAQAGIQSGNREALDHVVRYAPVFTGFRHAPE